MDAVATSFAIHHQRPPWRETVRNPNMSARPITLVNVCQRLCAIQATIVAFKTTVVGEQWLADLTALVQMVQIMYVVQAPIQVQVQVQVQV